MMVTTEGNCKINLALNVEGKLPNGYHRVKMIMQEVSLCDRISINFGGSGVHLSCSDSSIPTDEKNIAFRAAMLFKEKAGIDEGVSIHIEKNIPSEAGLGGGSADGAAVLKAMNDHYGKPLTEGELLSLGLKLGADVPFCIIGKTAIAEGVGEVLTPIENKLRMPVLIVKPEVGMSTPYAYGLLDEKGFIPVDTDSVASALESGNLEGLLKNMGNVFEQVAKEAAPEVFEIKSALLKSGARSAMMSGSGTAVFGIFDDRALLDNAFLSFKEKYKYTFKAEML